MGHRLAIEAVSAAFAELVRDAIHGVVAGSQVHIEPPGERPPTPAVRLYLYRLAHNPAMRNQPDQEGIDLHYFLAFYGEFAKFEPERMAEAVWRQVSVRPVLTVEGDAVRGPVRLSAETLGLEELSAAWSLFGGVPYALSLVYRAALTISIGRTPPQGLHSRDIYY